jgi:hypothetical protein
MLHHFDKFLIMEFASVARVDPEAHDIPSLGPGYLDVLGSYGPGAPAVVLASIGPEGRFKFHEPETTRLVGVRVDLLVICNPKESSGGV